MLSSFRFMISKFAWQMVVLPVDHSSQSKQCTALPALSHHTSCSSLASFVQTLIINSLKVSAVHLTFQTLISLIIHLTSTYLAWVAHSYEVIINLPFSLFHALLTSHLSSIFWVCFVILRIFVKIPSPPPKLFTTRICLMSCLHTSLAFGLWSKICSVHSCHYNHHYNFYSITADFIFTWSNFIMTTYVSL